MRKKLTAQLCIIIILVLIQYPLYAGLFLNSGKNKIKNILHCSTLTYTNTGIKVVSLDTGKTIFAENDYKLFIPASNTKLLTAYAALKTLTPQYTFAVDFSTDIYIDSSSVHNLYVKGCGDPLISLSDIKTQALILSEKIKFITGDIIIDNTYFDAILFGHGWMWDEGIDSWNAPISPYTLNGNCIDIFIKPELTPGSCLSAAESVPATSYASITISSASNSTENIKITREETKDGDCYIINGCLNNDSSKKSWKCSVSKPGLYAGTILKELLTKYGVKISGNVYEGASSTNTVIVDKIFSHNLVDIIKYFLKESDNLSGECILKTLGAVQYSPPGTADKGITVIENVLTGIGINKNSYKLADGSGLSTYNLISPDTLTKILLSAYNDFSISPEFVEALSIAGIDGTLKKRFKHTSIARQIRAKTGTMSGVSCVSGFMRTKKGSTLAVSIMMNGFTGSAKPFQDIQDEILKILWEEF